MEQFVFFLKSLTIKTIVFWLAIVYIAYMFSWVTAVPKILQHEGMVASMQNRGFMPIATLALGIIEVICAVALFFPKTRVSSLIILFLISVAAFSSHLTTHDPLWKFYRVGSMCILIPLALFLDERFKISLY